MTARKTPKDAAPKSRKTPARSSPSTAARAARDGKSAGTAGRARPVAAAKVTKKDLKLYEERLLAHRNRLVKELGYLQANVLKQNQRDSAGDLSGYSFHMADVGTDAMEREKAFLFASAEGRALYDVDEALRRLYTGTYGICESCQQPIAPARLEAVPHARLCVSCKEREERTARR